MKKFFFFKSETRLILFAAFKDPEIKIQSDCDVNANTNAISLL